MWKVVPCGHLAGHDSHTDEEKAAEHRPGSDVSDSPFLRASVAFLDQSDGQDTDDNAAGEAECKTAPFVGANLRRPALERVATHSSNNGGDQGGDDRSSASNVHQDSFRHVENGVIKDDSYK